MATSRTRHWATVVYPESCPDKWQDVLAGECVPAIISPLHNKDINPDGTPKKPHWHVLLLYAGPKSQAQVIELCKKFGGVLPIPISNAQSMARYFIHKDNPDKAQYSDNDIVNLSGADWSELVKTSRDRYDTLENIVAFMDEKQMFSYYDLVNYCRLNNRQWFEVVCDNTVLLKGLCQSGEWTIGQRHTRNLHDISELDPVPTRPVKPY